LKYNDGETNGNGDDNVSRWEMWVKNHMERHIVEYNLRRDHRSKLNFEENIFKKYDDNDDKEWSYDELIAHMSVDEALEIFDILGKDPVADERLSFAEVKQLIEDKSPLYRYTYGEYPKDPSTVDTSNVEI